MKGVEEEFTVEIYIRDTTMSKRQVPVFFDQRYIGILMFPVWSGAPKAMILELFCVKSWQV